MMFCVYLFRTSNPSFTFSCTSNCLHLIPLQHFIWTSNRIACGSTNLSIGIAVHNTKTDIRCLNTFWLSCASQTNCNQCVNCVLVNQNCVCSSFKWNVLFKSAKVLIWLIDWLIDWLIQFTLNVLLSILLLSKSIDNCFDNKFIL